MVAMRAWEEFLREQENKLNKSVVDKWLRPFKVLRFDACNLYLEAPDSFKALWFEEHMRQKVLSSFLNQNHKKIRVHISLPEAPKEQEPKKNISPLTTPPFHLSFDELNPEFTFQSFSPSENNLLAFKLFCEIANLDPTTFEKAPPTPPSFNPIYLVSRSGGGKTHLMMALASALKNQEKKVIYVRAERFCEHVVDAIRSGEMQAFRKAYRHTDVLLIDDIEVLSRKNATQEEFFHTFNALHLSGKQIVLSSIFIPQQLKFIAPRLISRFEWGVVLPMQHLNKEEMKKNLIDKAERSQFFLSNDVIDFLMETFSSSMKNLLRAFDALILRSHLHEDTNRSLAKVKEQLQDLIDEEEKSLLNPGKIIRIVAEHFDISTDKILSKSQNRECALPRQIAMHLCRHQLNMPFTKIGELFSRDHSTVMSSVDNIQKGIEGKNRDTTSAIAAILKKLDVDQKETISN